MELNLHLARLGIKRAPFGRNGNSNYRSLTLESGFGMTA